MRHFGDDNDNNACMSGHEKKMCLLLIHIWILAYVVVPFPLASGQCGLHRNIESSYQVPAAFGDETTNLVIISAFYPG